jgi:hypothetical protein
MTPDIPNISAPQVIDLTGLPEQTVHQVVQIVREAREKQAESTAPRSPNQDDPERWSAELRAWAESHPKRDITLDDDRDSIYAGCGE